MTITLENRAESKEEVNQTRSEQLFVTIGSGQLRVDMEHTPDGVIATEQESAIFGEGATWQAALTDLVEHLRVSVQDLQAHEDRLSPDLAEDLIRLRFLLSE
jgi:hypothetical protein